MVWLKGRGSVEREYLSGLGTRCRSEVVIDVAARNRVFPRVSFGRQVNPPTKRSWNLELLRLIFCAEGSAVWPCYVSDTCARLELV